MEKDGTGSGWENGRPKRSGWYLAGAVAAVVIVCLAGLGVLVHAQMRQSTGRSVIHPANSPSLNLSYEWNSYSVHAHDFEFGVSGLTSNLSLGSQTVFLYDPNGSTIDNFAFDLAISDQDPAIDSSPTLQCILGFITSGTAGSFVEGNLGSCNVANGGTIAAIFPGSSCGSATQCAPVTWVTGNGPTGTIDISGVGILSFPHTPWSTSTATYLDPIWCGYVKGSDP